MIKKLFYAYDNLHNQMLKPYIYFQHSLYTKSFVSSKYAKEWKQQPNSIFDLSFTIDSVICVLTETISAIHLLVFPLSSLIVIGLPSLILSKAAGQSNCNKDRRNIVIKNIQNYLLGRFCINIIQMVTFWKCFN